MRALFVGDSLSLCSTLKDHIDVTKSTTEDALQYLLDFHHDIVVICFRDLALLKAIRARKLTVPVIVLSDTAESSAHELSSFSAGADDFVRIPYNDEVLAARAKAIIRRFNGHSKPLLTCGNLALDTERKVALLKGSVVRLTRDEYKTLEGLMLHPQRILSIKMLVDLSHNPDEDGDEVCIRTRVCRIRKKMSNFDAEHRYIHAVWGRGYRLEELPASTTLHIKKAKAVG